MNLTTTVINVRTGAPYDVYIGRRMNRGKYRLPESKWHNPSRFGTGAGDRAQAIAEYRTYLRARPELLAALPELRGKVLGCWCAPEACHGDVLAELAEQEGGDETA